MLEKLVSGCRDMLPSFSSLTLFNLRDETIAYELVVDAGLEEIYLVCHLVRNGWGLNFLSTPC